MFKGFKPQGLQKIATRMGYAGSMENFDDYLKQNPDKEREMIVYRAKAQEMARGGVVKAQEGKFIGPALPYIGPAEANPGIGQKTDKELFIGYCSPSLTLVPFP